MKKLSTRNMILAALFAALTAVGAFISIPIGQVPITLQTLFTILSGLILGANLGLISQLIYVILGLVGLPIFAGGTGGFNSIMHPTFGFLIGFIIASFVIGKLSEKLQHKSFIKLFIITVTGSFIIYLIGVPYLYFIINKFSKGITFPIALKTACLVFIPGDLIKCAIASLVATKIIPILKKENLIK